MGKEILMAPSCWLWFVMKISRVPNYWKCRVSPSNFPKLHCSIMENQLIGRDRMNSHLLSLWHMIEIGNHIYHRKYTHNFHTQLRWIKIRKRYIFALTIKINTACYLLSMTWRDRSHTFYLSLSLSGSCLGTLGQPHSCKSIYELTRTESRRIPWMSPIFFPPPRLIASPFARSPPFSRSYYFNFFYWRSLLFPHV